MSRLKQRTTRIELDFLGEEWQGAYVEVKRLHWGDLTRYDQVDRTNVTNKDAEKMIADALAEVFVSGRAPDEEGHLFDLAAADLKDFDIDAQTRIYHRTMGDIDPNA